jgi:hypothetical protein
MFSNLTTFRFRVSWFLLTYLAMVARVALSHNDKNHCRDAKDDSYTEGLDSELGDNMAEWTERALPFRING